MAVKTNAIITVNNRKSIVNKDLWCYEDDKNIDIYFMIEDERYEVISEEQSLKYYSFTIIKPNGLQIDRNELIPIETNHIKLKIDGVSDFDEVGKYIIQIHLYDTDDINTRSEFKIPEVNFEIVSRAKGKDAVLLNENSINLLTENENPINYNGNLGIKISEMPELNSYTGNGYTPLNYEGTTYRVNVDNLTKDINNDILNNTNNIKKNTNEINKASEDYFHVQHENLYKRLYEDFKKVWLEFQNASLLRYEGSYITANNTLLGNTDSLVLKGRTLQNICPVGVSLCNDLAKFNHNYPSNLNITKGDNYIQSLTMTDGTWNSVGYDDTSLKIDTKYIVISEVEVVKNEANIDIKVTCGGKSETNIQTLKIGRGILISKSITSNDLTQTNSRWVSVQFKSNTGIKTGDGYKVYSIDVYEVNDIEFNMTAEEILNKFPVRLEGIGLVKGNLNVRSCGKNLCDNSKNQLKNIRADNGEEFNDGSCIISDYIKIYDKNVVASKIETSGIQGALVSYRIYDFNKNYIGSDISLLKPNYYIRLRCLGANSSKFNTSQDIQFQLEYGATATEFEPYIEDKITINQIKLIGNSTIQDTLDSNGILTRRWGSRPYQTGDELLNNVFTDKTITYYQLSTPVTESINFRNLNSYKGNTNIIADGTLIQPIISVKIPSNVQAVVSSLSAENTNLNNQVSTLSEENQYLKSNISNLNDVTNELLINNLK